MKQHFNTIYWRFAGPVVLVGSIAIMAILFTIPKLIEQNVSQTAKAHAVELVETFREIRNYYNNNVIENVLTNGNVDITHMPEQIPDSIPAPATFLLGMTAGRMGSDVSVSLTSPLPFTHRQDRKLDNFQLAAWNAFRQNPDMTAYTGTDMMDGKEFYRVAIADKLNKETCVSCHNSHQASPKTDWNLGDVRGLIEVRINVTEQLANGYKLSWFIAAIFCIAIICLLLFAHFSARKLSIPLGNVTLSLQGLARDHAPRTDAHLPNMSVREICQLTQAFDLFQEKERERQRLTDDIKRLAFFDNLTGLSNKTRFQHSLKQAIITSEGQDTAPMVILLELDRYRDVTDTMGHDAGDGVLRELSDRLRTFEPNYVRVARYGDYTFALLTVIEKTATPEQRLQLIERIRHLITQPISHEGQPVNLEASFGLACAPDHGSSVDALITAADIALAKAKTNGRGQAVIYSTDLADDAQFRISIANDLKKALDHRQLIPYFQPQYDLATGALIGAEALIRWPRNDGSFLSPGIFIPIAEQAQMITRIGHYMIDQVCSYAAKWHARGLQVPRLAINISALQFAEENVAEIIKAALDRYQISANFLEVEITESAMSDNVDLVIERLAAIQALGVEISLDDFGTGYSSLSYLQRLPLNRLKIDQSFVREMTRNEQSVQIVKTIIALGRAMNLAVLAEGIETEPQGTQLKAYGCMEGQGYHYGKPMPPEDFYDFAVRKLSEAEAIHPVSLKSTNAVPVKPRLVAAANLS